MRFTLEPTKWYAAELIGEDVPGCIKSCTPIKVYNIKPESPGSRTFTLDFYHAAYPAGVRDKTYRLTTIERNRAFILASSEGHSPKRFLLIYSMSAQWLAEHFSVELEPGQSPEQWLERNA